VSAARLVLASHNDGKLAELARSLSGLPVVVLSAREALGRRLDVEETGATFEDNARIKAVFVRNATGLLTLADDSGLEVDALNGRPGVRSARYAGEHATDRDNMDKLLRELGGVEPERRGARFRCVLSLAPPDHEVLSFSGCCEGRIALRARGNAGFGYDPIFELPTGCTMAELAPEEKSRVSHRGRAFVALREYLARWLEARSRAGK
jgi:XTP/dITP diphosphohydrolase